MKRLQAYKFRAEFDGEQLRKARQFDGCRRFVFNRGLEASIEYYAQNEKSLGYHKLAGELVALKKVPEMVWLKEAPSQILQQALMDLQAAYKNFFEKRAKFPTFKKKGTSSGFRFPQGFKLDEANRRVFLPKLGFFRYRASQKVLGTVKSISVSTHGGHWYLSILTEREVEDRQHPSTSGVGVDFGVKRYATLSTGEFEEPLDAYKQKMTKLARYQRKMSRQRIFSKNWGKTKQKLQQLHARIAQCRRDMIHKFTTQLCNNHALIVIEDLRVKNMSASAAGTSETPGRNVRQKSGLNRSILDQGWGISHNCLKYKQTWRNGMLLAVPPQYTSQTCPHCGQVSPDNRRTQSQFKCVRCGTEGHADHIAAINIYGRGQHLLACGDLAQSGGSMKQEPIEETLQHWNKSAVCSVGIPVLSALAAAVG